MKFKFEEFCDEIPHQESLEVSVEIPSDLCGQISETTSPRQAR